MPKRATRSMNNLHWIFAADTQSEISDLGALLLRLTVGMFLVYFHGWHKLSQGIRYVNSGAIWPLLDDVKMLGMPSPVVGAFGATVTQLIGGLSVAAGFLTRPSAAVVTVSLLVAVYANYRAKKENQLALLYALLFAGFSLYGGGRYSVDAFLFGGMR